MKHPPLIPRRRAVASLLGSILIFTGCGESEPDPLSVVPRDPEQAAAQVDQVFRDAPAPVQTAAAEASAAMRRGDYEQAVVSLQLARNQEAITLQQGMAIHNSMVAMETSLIRAMEAGDPQARQAYEILRRLKRGR